jgi:hypothetical protein
VGRDVKEAGPSMNVALPVTARPSGDRLVISSWQSNAITVYDLKENRTTRTIDGNYPIDAVMFGNDVIVSELLTHGVVAVAPDGTRRTLAAGMKFLEGSGAEGSSWMPGWLKGFILRSLHRCPMEWSIPADSPRRDRTFGWRIGSG